MNGMYFKDWNEATTFMENNDPREVDTEDMRIVYSSVLVSMVTDTSLLGRMVLEELTGLDLDSNENLYDYFSKNIKLDKQKAMKYGITVVAQSGGLSDIEEMLKEFKGPL